jgi:hypothetical protein
VHQVLASRDRGGQSARRRRHGQDGHPAGAPSRVGREWTRRAGRGADQKCGQ